MTLEEYIEGIPNDKQFRIAVELTKCALPIWDRYAEKHKLTYRDSVTGLSHHVDKNLLRDTIDAIETLSKKGNTERKNEEEDILGEQSDKFEDPIVALQDSDWELPDEVEKIFYSVYNLTEFMIGNEETVFDEPTIFVAINQAADALITNKIMTFHEIIKLCRDIHSDKKHI
jgi:hypothetical protein